MTASSVRRSRGYSWERRIVSRFIEEGWHAYRLGGTTTDMPDVIALSNNQPEGCVIECKSTAENHAYVPAAQILRLQDMARALWRYHPATILSFLFRATKNRKQKEYHIWAPPMQHSDYRMSYDGRGACRIQSADNDKGWFPHEYVLAKMPPWDHTKKKEGAKE